MWLAENLPRWKRWRNNIFCACMKIFMGQQKMILVVEGGAVQHILTTFPTDGITIYLLDHDVQEWTGHKHDGEDIVWGAYENEIALAPTMVENLVKKCSIWHEEEENV